MTDSEAAIVTVCAFMAGFTLGIAAAVRERKGSSPDYIPTRMESDIAQLLEPDDLEQAAFLVERDGLVAYLVKPQQAN